MLTVATLVLGASLEPGGLIAWLVVGLIAGFLASVVMRGGGYGIVGDIIVGIVGLHWWIAGEPADSWRGLRFLGQRSGRLHWRLRTHRYPARGFRWYTPHAITETG
jgi:hypothetical protein